MNGTKDVKWGQKRKHVGKFTSLDKLLVMGAINRSCCPWASRNSAVCSSSFPQVQDVDTITLLPITLHVPRPNETCTSLASTVNITAHFQPEFQSWTPTSGRGWGAGGSVRAHPSQSPASLSPRGGAPFYSVTSKPILMLKIRIIHLTPWKISFVLSKRLPETQYRIV